MLAQSSHIYGQDFGDKRAAKAFCLVIKGNATDTYTSIEDIYGSSFNDRLKGDTLSNTIWGGDGMDTLQGWAGNDILFGGRGADAFYFARGWGSDRIVDFERGIDVVNFVGFGLLREQIQGFSTQIGADLVIKIGVDTLTLNGTTYEQSHDSFIFI